MSPPRKGICNFCTAQRGGGESGSNLENYLFANRLAAAPAHEAGALDKQPQGEPACESHPFL